MHTFSEKKIENYKNFHAFTSSTFFLLFMLIGNRNFIISQIISLRLKIILSKHADIMLMKGLNWYRKRKKNHQKLPEEIFWLYESANIHSNTFSRSPLNISRNILIFLLNSQLNLNSRQHVCFCYLHSSDIINVTAVSNTASYT